MRGPRSTGPRCAAHRAPHGALSSLWAMLELLLCFRAVGWRRLVQVRFVQEDWNTCFLGNPGLTQWLKLEKTSHHQVQPSSCPLTVRLPNLHAAFKAHPHQI